jgi:Small Multidrug Resistance (SMR) protein
MPTGPDLPSTAMLMRIAADHGLDLTPADADSYRALMAGAIESYRKLEEFSEPEPPVKYPRDGGWRPTSADNPFNGWYWRCNIAGAASGAGRRSGWTAHPPTSEHSRIGSPGARWPTRSAPRSPPRLRKARCGHGKPRRPSLRASDHSRACASDRCTRDLGRLFWALSQVLTRIPMGLAYAIWFEAGIALICVARLARAQASGPAHELRRRHTTVDC